MAPHHPDDTPTAVFPWGFAEALALCESSSVVRNHDGCFLVTIDEAHRAVIGQWDDTGTFRAVRDWIADDARTWYASFVAVGEACLIHLRLRKRRHKV